MSLRCGNCSSAFFSQKLLDRHQQKCSSIPVPGKTRYTVRVQMSEEEAASTAMPDVAITSSSGGDNDLPTAAAAAAVMSTGQLSNSENVSPSSQTRQQRQPAALQARQQQPQQPPPTITMQARQGRQLRVDIPLRSPDGRRRIACNACGKLFAGQRCCSWLIDHLRVEHLEQQPHSCPYCDTLFVYFDTMQEHVAACYKAKLQQPRNPQTEDAADENLQHQQQSQQQSQQQDPALLQHSAAVATSAAAEGYAYCCGLCNETYADLPLLLKHFADLHPEFASPDELVAAATAPLMQQQQQQQLEQLQTVFSCALCSQSFDQLITGQLHLQRHHPAEWRQVVSCPVCHMNCKTQSLNQAHILATHADAKAAAGPGVYPCRLCRKSFAGADQLYEHLTTVHAKPMANFIVETTVASGAAGGAGDTLYECGGCKLRYKDRMLLEGHFQAGCPSLASGVPNAGHDDASMVDTGDDAYLHASVMSASISA